MNTPAPQVPGFEIVRRVGRGGMGEVFHAVRVAAGGFRKPVALKRLALDASIDAKAVQRFLAEARISAQLDHPNIVRVHDLLVVEHGHFIVMELLRGRNLVDFMRALRDGGAAPWWVPLAVVEQVLAGLEYAHALRGEDGRPLGLVHRDLTPRNVFVCESGVAKILDFGIAKLRNAMTPGLTRDGALQGTLEFLSPEQARGEAADARTDLYQVAATLYWALTDEFPHGSGSPAEIVARALSGKARPLAELRDDLPAAVVTLVEQAMSPDREDRPADARAMRAALRDALSSTGKTGDAAALAALAGSLPPAMDEVPPIGSAHSPAARGSDQAFDATVPASSALDAVAAPAHAADPAAAVSPVSTAGARGDAPARRVTAARVAVVLGALAATAGAGYFAGRGARKRPAPPPAAAAEPDFTRLTFRRGTVHSARFTPDAASYVYSAAWDGAGVEPFLGFPTSPEARRLDLPGAQLLSISRRGELALLVDVTGMGYMRTGTLARGVTVTGGAPRDLVEDASWAEWHPTTEEFLVVRRVEDRWRLEYPQGNVLYENASGWLGNPRFSPNGDRIAFIDHPLFNDDRGFVTVIDLAGNKRHLTKEWSSAQGLAWSPSGEIWFTASDSGHERSLRAVDDRGQVRVLQSTPLALTLLDVSPAGKALLTAGSPELRSAGHGAGEARERDLSFLHFSFVGDFAPDGKSLYMVDGGSDSGGAGYTSYLRNLAGGAFKPLGHGMISGPSPDGKWLVQANKERNAIQLAPSGAGDVRPLPFMELLTIDRTGQMPVMIIASWFADGKRLIISTRNADGEKFHVYDTELYTYRTLDLTGLTYVFGDGLSPDGKSVVLYDPNAKQMVLAPIDGGPVRAIPGVRPGERQVRWDRGGRALYVSSVGPPTTTIDRLDLDTGARTTWQTLTPDDPAGVIGIVSMFYRPDVEAYAYTYYRNLSTLYLVDGLK